MAKHRFLRAESKAAFRAAVESVEDQSAAEVVVAVRPWAASYRAVDLGCGAVAAVALLTYMVYTPTRTFNFASLVLYPAVGFWAGALLSAVAGPLRRLLIPRRRREAEVRRLGSELFYDLGISRTRDRSGILVLVSLFEQTCVVLPDIGITESVPTDAWATLKQRAEEAVRQTGVGQQGAQALADAIRSWSTPLAAHLPRRDDDVNELPDLAEDFHEH